MTTANSPTPPKANPTTISPTTTAQTNSGIISNSTTYPSYGTTYHTTGGTYNNWSVMGGNSNITYSQVHPTSIISFNGSNSKEIVRLNVDGTVTWNGEINVNEAAEAFARAISLGTEIKAGITQRVKLDMRDSVFNDLIEIAREKGTLTADDLTYLLKASKIVEKLKGEKDL